MESRFFGWDQARLYLSWRTGLGLASFLLVAFSTGDVQAKMVARHKPATLAAMEGRFQNGPMTEITLIGQSNVQERRLENPIQLPGMLSFLAFGAFHSDLAGLDAFPEAQRPDNFDLF